MWNQRGGARCGLDGSGAKSSLPFKGRAKGARVGMGQAFNGDLVEQPHPHLNPPLEGEETFYRSTLRQTGRRRRFKHVTQSFLKLMWTVILSPFFRSLIELGGKCSSRSCGLDSSFTTPVL